MSRSLMTANKPFRMRNEIARRIAAFVVMLAIGVLALSPATPAAAQAAAVCDARAEVLRHLERQYAEAPVALGLANTGGVVEVLASPNGATWTIIVTLPDGTSCLVAAGESWETVPRLTAGAKA